MAQGNNPFWNCNCGCMDKPDVAKFAERLDAIGGDKGKLTFSTLLPDTTAEARVYDLGSRPRGEPPIDALFATHTITEKSFSIVTLLRDVPPVLRRDEIDAIVQDITERFELMLRTALWGGQSK
jgi:hypothetical protein